MVSIIFKLYYYTISLEKSNTKYKMEYTKKVKTIKNFICC